MKQYDLTGREVSDSDTNSYETIGHIVVFVVGVALGVVAIALLPRLLAHL